MVLDRFMLGLFGAGVMFGSYAGLTHSQFSRADASTLVLRPGVKAHLNGAITNMGCFATVEAFNEARSAAMVGDTLGLQEAEADHSVQLTPGTAVLGIEYEPSAESSEPARSFVRIRVYDGQFGGVACWLPSATKYFK